MHNSPSAPAVRDDFMLRRDWRLLNNGSFGACPQPVFDVYQQWQREFEKHPGGYMAVSRANLTEARTKLATYLHTDQSRLAFVTNATMGVNVVTHSLRSILQPGDEVLTSNHEYGACNHAWQFNCQKTGAHYINYPIALPIHSDEDFIERFWAGVMPRTRVIYLRSCFESLMQAKNRIKSGGEKVRIVGSWRIVGSAIKCKETEEPHEPSCLPKRFERYAMAVTRGLNSAGKAGGTPSGCRYA